jgi:NAD(P)-dependent dehydrogenase (short-subunit alcohol dehydrogenase family)
MDTDTGGYLKSLFGLKGERALVTGASSGLGAASAAALAAAGADVVVSGRDVERTQAVADAVGGSAEVADVLEPRAAEQLASRALEGGPVDILVNAGRVGKPDEIVGAVLYLASPASDMVVGHTLMVDGGRIAI